MSKRIIYYYQTFSTLRPILDHPTCCGVTHIHLSAFHFGTNKDGSPYIHMNNYNPEDKQFVDVWKEIEEAHNKGIKIQTHTFYDIISFIIIFLYSFF